MAGMEKTALWAWAEPEPDPVDRMGDRAWIEWARARIGKSLWFWRWDTTIGEPLEFRKYLTREYIRKNMF